MSTKRDERLDIGRRLFHKELSFDEARRTYQVSDITLRNWIKEYKIHAGITGPELEVSDTTKSYAELEKEELIQELMKKDIEIERLKKGYAVKGVGAEKEFVTINDVNTKSS